MPFGALASILVGVLYVVFAVAFTLLPADLQPLGAAPEQYLPAEARRDPTELIARSAFTLASLLALAVAPSMTRRARRGDDELLMWTMSLALLGFAVLAITELRRAAILSDLGERYAGADVSLRAALAALERSASLEPFGWLGFGATGLWAATLSVISLRRRLGPPQRAWLGLALGVLYWIVLVGFGTSTTALVQARGRSRWRARWTRMVHLARTRRPRRRPCTVTDSLRRLGGWGALLACVANIAWIPSLVGLGLTMSQREPPEGAALLGLLARNSTAFVILAVESGIAAVLAFAYIPALSRYVRDGPSDGPPRFTGALAFLGAALSAVTSFRTASLMPTQAAEYVTADPALRTAIAA